MSVTFALMTENEQGMQLFGCPVDHRATPCDDPTDPEHVSDRECYDMCDCTMRAREACEECLREVNVSNTNAMAIFERLGIEFDYAGTISGEELLGRALMGNVGRDDSGVAPTVDRGAGGVTMIECGLRDGYFESRLGALADLATEAVARGCDIGWG